MSFIDKMLGRVVNFVPEGISVVVPLERPRVNTDAIKAARLRPNMWVVTQGDIGILSGCLADGTALVTLIKPDGSTKMILSPDDKAVPAEVACSLASIRQTFIEEIPKSRYESVVQLKAIGYRSAE